MQNYTLTLEDAREINSSVKGLIRLLRIEERKSVEKQNNE